MSKETDDEYSGQWWAKELSAAEKELDVRWRTSGDKIVNRYLDIREDEVGDTKKYNVFWANTQILKSALYATPPKPVVKRQHDDAKDDIARTASLMLQRILTFSLDKQNSDMHSAFKQATEDRLIPGLGQVWLRYEVETSEETVEAEEDPTGVTAAPTTYEVITNQEVHTDYVSWRDFLWSPARTWQEVWWVARRVWMKKKAFIKKFGQEVYDDIRRESEEMNEHGYPKGFSKGRVEVMEIWCEDTNSVYFVHAGTKTLLSEPIPDPLKLENFWPCPMPLLATHTTNSLVPRPDFVMVQDQYDELDVLNDRVNMLTKALRVVGVYDATNTALAKLLTGEELTMIAVDKWAMMAEAGGLRGSVDWFPIEQVANVLKVITEQRILIVQQIYELTSISDIMRGGSNPRETLGAQKLKAQYSSVRLRVTQQEVAEFACEAMRIKAEIIAKHFEPEQIYLKSLIDQTESQMYAADAIKLLKDFEISQYRIEISEESLSMADYTAEREMRIAYLTAVGQFLSQSGQIVAGMPQALPYIIKIIKWVTASFRGSDDIETVLDEAADAALKIPPQNKEKPDHTKEVAQMNMQKDLQLAQLNSKDKQAAAQLSAQIDREKIASTEKIAEQERNLQFLLHSDKTQKDLQIADKKAGVSESDVSKILQPLNDAISGLIHVVTSPRKKVPVRNAQGDILYVEELPISTEEMGAVEDISASVKKLTDSLSTPRRSVPVRGKDGEILFVENSVGDPNVQN